MTIISGFPINLIDSYLFLNSNIIWDSLDSNNRPVLEGRSIYHKIEESDYCRCKISDSRNNSTFKMNKKALKLTLSDLEFITSAFCSFKNQFYFYSNLSNHDLYDYRYLNFSSYCFYRYINAMRIDDNRLIIDSSIASLNKVSQGLLTLSLSAKPSILNRMISLKNDEVFNYIDRSKILFGNRTNEVCPASKKVIKDLIFLNGYQEKTDFKLDSDLMKKTSMFYCFDLIAFTYASYKKMYLCSIGHEYDDLSYIKNRETILREKNPFKSLIFECIFFGLSCFDSMLMKRIKLFLKLVLSDLNDFKFSHEINFEFFSLLDYINSILGSNVKMSKDSYEKIFGRSDRVYFKIKA